MADHERAMLAYATLASLAWRKKQLPGRDRFLVLTGASACRAGWPEVAERCRALILANNPRHRVAANPTFVEAMRDPDFAPFLRQQERFCGYERAEHLLRELAIDLAGAPDTGDVSAGERALALIEKPDAPGTSAPVA